MSALPGEFEWPSDALRWLQDQKPQGEEDLARCLVLLSRVMRDVVRYYLDRQSSLPVPARVLHAWVQAEAVDAFDRQICYDLDVASLKEFPDG